MDDILWMIKNTLKITFRKKVNFIVYFLLPVLGIAIAMLAYGNDKGASITIGVIDNDKGYIAEDATKYLDSIGKFKVVEVKADEVKSKVVSGELNSVITFHKDFTESIYNKEPKNIEITTLNGEEATTYIKFYLNDYIDNLVDISKTSKGDENKFKNLYENFKDENIRLSIESPKDVSKNKDITSQTIGLLFMFTLMVSGNLTEIILKEKRERTFFRISCSGINSRKYILANLIVNLLILSIQNVIVLFILTKVIKIDILMPSQVLFIILTIFTVVAIGASFLIVAFSKTSSAVSATKTVVYVLTCMISGSFFPFEVMPKVMQRIASLTPQRWALSAIDKMQGGGELSSITMNLAILLAFAMVFFLIAVYKIKESNEARDFV